MKLTNTESAILNALTRSRSMSTDQILKTVWGKNPIERRGVSAHIVKLRKKLANATIEIIYSTADGKYHLIHLDDGEELPA